MQVGFVHKCSQCYKQNGKKFLHHSNNSRNSNFLVFEFGKYLELLPSKSAVSSQVCKYVYEHYPQSKKILARHGKLRGLVKSCPYLQMDGGAHGGTFILSLNLEVFSRIRRL